MTTNKFREWYLPSFFFFFPCTSHTRKTCQFAFYSTWTFNVNAILDQIEHSQSIFFSISYINRPNVFIKQKFLEETATTKKQITLVSYVHTESHISWEHLFANQILTTFFHFFFSPSLAWLSIQCIMKSDFHFLRLLYHFSFKSFFSQPISVPCPSAYKQSPYFIHVYLCQMIFLLILFLSLIKNLQWLLYIWEDRFRFFVLLLMALGNSIWIYSSCIQINWKCFETISTLNCRTIFFHLLKYCFTV